MTGMNDGGGQQQQQQQQQPQQQQPQQQQPAIADYTPFYANLSEDNKRVFADRKFDPAKSDANALLDTIRNQDKLIGANNLPSPRLDDDAELAKWPGWKALGVPESGDKYDLKRPDKLPEGMPWDEEGEKVARNAFLKAKVPAKLAQGAFDELVNMQIARARAQATQLKEAAAAAETELKSAWGSQFEIKRDGAKRAAITLAEKAGVKLDGAAVTDRLALLYGDANALKILDYVSGAMSEGSMRGGDKPSGGANTPEAAKAEIDKLETDKDFMEAYQTADHPGHRAAVERMSRLHKLATPERKKD